MTAFTERARDIVLMSNARTTILFRLRSRFILTISPSSEPERQLSEAI